MEFYAGRRVHQGFYVGYGKLAAAAVIHQIHGFQVCELTQNRGGLGCLGGGDVRQVQMGCVPGIGIAQQGNGIGKGQLRVGFLQSRQGFIGQIRVRQGQGGKLRQIGKIFQNQLRVELVLLEHQGGGVAAGNGAAEVHGVGYLHLRIHPDILHNLGVAGAPRQIQLLEAGIIGQLGNIIFRYHDGKLLHGVPGIGGGGDGFGGWGGLVGILRSPAARQEQTQQQ